MKKLILSLMILSSLTYAQDDGHSHIETKVCPTGKSIRQLSRYFDLYLKVNDKLVFPKGSGNLVREQVSFNFYHISPKNTLEIEAGTEFLISDMSIYSLSLYNTGHSNLIYLPNTFTVETDRPEDISELTKGLLDIRCLDYIEVLKP